MPPKRSPATALLVALGGVVAGVVLVVVILALAGSGDVEVRLGDDQFDAGDAENRAASVASDGPLLFSDVSGGTRDIILQHLGDDPGSAWVAFDAQPPGRPRDCFLEWHADDDRFVATCDPDATYPPDGTGLTTYPARVDGDGNVVVDLRTAGTAP